MQGKCIKITLSRISAGSLVGTFGDVRLLVLFTPVLLPLTLNHKYRDVKKLHSVENTP
jgi:hypothetical protein